MGMFQRLAKENERRAQAQSKWADFEKSLQLQIQGFEASNDIGNQYYERASSSEYLDKLVSASEKKRDEATQLNLHGFAAAFSSIHCRTFLRINQDVLLGTKAPTVVFGKYGVKSLSSLHSDIRYLAWGVAEAGVDKVEYWECKTMVDLYQFRIIELAKSKLESGKIEISDNFTLPPTVELVDWRNYEWTLLAPTNVITPSVPPLEL
jgi:hypothetical protein